MNAIIELKDGRWLLNNKRFDDLSKTEVNILNGFFTHCKTEQKQNSSLTLKQL